MKKELDLRKAVVKNYRDLISDVLKLRTRLKEKLEVIHVELEGLEGTIGELNATLAGAISLADALINTEEKE